MFTTFVSINAARALLFKTNLNVSRSSEHPPSQGGEMSKRLGGIIGCKDKTSSCYFKKNLSASKPSNNRASTQSGRKIIKTFSLGGKISSKDQNYLWHLIGFPMVVVA